MRFWSSYWYVGWIAVTALGLSACGQVATSESAATATPAEINLSFTAPENIPTSTFSDPVLRDGEKNFQLYCAHCHGYQAGGQAVGAPGDTERLGMKLVPPLDSTGNTWRYADQVLIDVITNGIQNPLNQYPMLGWGNVLNDYQIRNLLRYIKTFWTDEQRAHQRQVTANLAAAREQAGMNVTPAVTAEHEPGG